MSVAFILVSLILMLMATSTVLAQNKPVMERPLAIALIRDALAALNQANWSGNYTVLRDYAAPGFAAANDPTRLTAIFQPLRAAGLDLFPAMILDPVITRGQMVENNSKIRISGYFPSLPRHIQFDLLFEPIDNRWRLFGIAVAPMQPPAQNTVSTPSQSVPAEAAIDKPATQSGDIEQQLKPVKPVAPKRRPQP